MILYSVKKAKNPHLSDGEACDLAGIDRQLPSRWLAKYGHHYREWIEEALDHDSADDAEVLERVGMVNAVQGNYQFWRDMARQKGVIKEEVKEVKISINTDFSALLNGVNGDIVEARKRILLKARGVVVPGGPGMAAAAGVGEYPGAGDGAGELQERPLEMANALGTDRGRSERDQPLPALSERPAFASAYRVLDEGEVPPGAEE